MTNTTPDLTIPGPTLAELRVRMDTLNKVRDWRDKRWSTFDNTLEGPAMYD